jgi:hypothetical protein
MAPCPHCRKYPPKCRCGEKKSPFQVGDRVRVYGIVVRMFGAGEAIKKVATVTSVDDELLILDDGGDAFYAHPKQCRRLVKKERRRYWLNPNISAHYDGTFWIDNKPHEGWIEFVEVKK